MIVEVDLTAPSPPPPRLLDRWDFASAALRVAVLGTVPRWEALAAALGGDGHVERGRVWLSRDALVAAADELGRDSRWLLALERMLAEGEGEGEGKGGDGAIELPVEWVAEVPIEPEEFRHVLGHYPTGVCVLTADGSQGPVGMTCNSFTSVSLRPPLIAVCPARASETWPEIRVAGRFVVNLIHCRHEQAARAFAAKEADRFAAIPYHQRLCGPALDEAIAWIECRLEVEHDAGDHTIALARVVALEADRDDDPLVFFRGAFGTFVHG